MRSLTIPQIDPDALPSAHTAPELALLAAIIHLAVLDLCKPYHRAEARAFIDSDGFEQFCEWLGWDAGWVRQAIVEDIAPK